MSLTTDPSHPDLTRYTGPEQPAPQAKVYLVLSEEERAKGFIRPVRQTYVHVGIQPKNKLRPLDEDQKKKYGDDWVAYEQYPRSESDSDRGRFWTQKEVDNIGKGCGTETKMGLALSETYARDPKFYGATYCVGCSAHFPVAEFKWGDGEVVGS